MPKKVLMTEVFKISEGFEDAYQGELPLDGADSWADDPQVKAAKDAKSRQFYAAYRAAIKAKYRFQSGADRLSTAYTDAAIERGISPESFADRVAAWKKFKKRK